MKENYENTAGESKFGKKEIEEAIIGFEKLAQRLDELYQKDKLTPGEKKEVELILNNASIIDEVVKGEMPEEFRL